MTFEEILVRFETTKKTTSGWMARCPAHDDNHASLHISEGASGTLLKCHAGCEFIDIIRAVNLQASDLFYKSQRVAANGGVMRSVFSPQPRAKDESSVTVRPKKAEPSVVNRIIGQYAYHNAEGEVVYEAVKYGPDKTFKQRAKVNGKWRWKMDGVERVLYNLPAILAAHPDTTIWVVEGEKDVETLRQQGLIATCNVGGAGKWRAEYSETLRGRTVVIIPDNDLPGQRHAGDVDRSLQGIAKSVSILNLPNMPEHGDVTDWMAINGNDAERLCQMADDIAYVKQHEPEVQYTQAPPEESNGQPSHPSKWRRTHEGMAMETLTRLNENYQWIHDLSPDLKGDAGWAHWEGERWVFGPPAITAISDLMRSMTAEYRDYARELLERAGGQRASLTQDEKTAVDFSTQLESSHFKKGWAGELKTFGGIHTSINDFDSNNWVLTVENGVLDLRTGQLLPFDRRFKSSKRTSVKYDPLATCSRWDVFLQEIFNYDAELIQFIQRAVGYSLTGETSEQCLFLCHGAGANGKSVFLEVLLRLLGEFGVDAPVSTFSSKPANANNASNDLAMLRGARLVTATETNEGMRFDEAIVKKLTGGDRVTARKLYQDFFYYIPNFKIWIAMNHKPSIRGTDNGIWRRMRLIPFDRIFSVDQQDRKLKFKLFNELPGILNWALRGCLDWQQNGLPMAQIVEDATNEYRAAEDTLGQFIEENCIVGEHYQVPAQLLYDTYAEWARRSNIYVNSLQKFGRQLTDRGFITRPSGTGGKKVRFGIGLLQ